MTRRPLLSNPNITMAPITRATFRNARVGHNTLTVPRRFRFNSDMYKYLANRSPIWVSKNTHASSLYKALQAMDQIIREDGLFDPGNPIVVIGNSKFTKLMGKEILFTSQIVQIIRSHFEPLHPYIHDSLTPLPKIPKRTGKANFDVQAMYDIRPKMRVLLQNTSNAPPPYIHELLYADLCQYIRRYICENGKRLIHPIDSELLDLRGDILGEIFKAKIIHRNQTTEFLRQHLQSQEK